MPRISLFSADLDCLSASSFVCSCSIVLISSIRDMRSSSARVIVSGFLVSFSPSQFPMEGRPKIIFLNPSGHPVTGCPNRVEYVYVIKMPEKLTKSLHIRRFDKFPHPVQYFIHGSLVINR